MTETNGVVFLAESVSLKIKDELFTDYLDREQINVKASLTADNEFSFTLIIMEKELKQVQVGSSVTLDYVWIGTPQKVYRLFTGFIQTIESHPSEQGNEEQFRIQVKCVGLRDVLDKRTVFYYTEVPEKPSTFKAIIEKYIQDQLANENFKIGQIDLDFPTPSDFKYEIGTVSGFFDEIASITGFNWYINHDKTIDFLKKPKIRDVVPSTPSKLQKEEFILVSSQNTLDDYYNKIIIRSPVLKAQITDIEEVRKMQERNKGSGVYCKIYSVDTDTTNWKPIDVCKEMLLNQSFERQSFTFDCYSVIFPGYQMKFKWQGFTYDLIATESEIYFREKNYFWSRVKFDRLPPEPKKFNVRTDWKIKFGKFISTSNNRKKGRKKKRTVTSQTAKATFKLGANDIVIISLSAQIKIREDIAFAEIEVLLNDKVIGGMTTNSKGESAKSEFFNMTKEIELPAGTHTASIRTSSSGAPVSVTFISFRVDSESFAEVPLIDAGDENLSRIINEESDGKFKIQKDNIIDIDGNILGGDSLEL